MAEGWAKKLGEELIEAYSAGTENYSEVKHLAVEVHGLALICPVNIGKTGG